MPPLRRSNRASKPRVYWDPTITPPHRRQQPVFTIYTEPTEPTESTEPTKPTEGLGTKLPEGLGTQLSKGLGTQFPEDLGIYLSEDLSDDEGLSDDKGLSDDEDFSDDEGLSDDEDFSDDEGLSNDEGLSDNEDFSDDEGLDNEGLHDEDLDDKGLDDEDLSEILSRQLHKDLGVQLPYQPPFLPKDRAGKPQNLPENSDPFKLFQLFFSVKEIQNIVKETNQRAAYIGFKRKWIPLTVTETYQYLGCLVYMAVQPLRELSDHWSHLNSPVRSCFSERRFKQIQRAFAIRDANTSPEQPGDPWWFRVEPLATNIRKACQKYWAPGAHPAIDEGMIPYLGRTRHAIKAPHKPIKQGYKFWALADLGYIYNWLWHSKARGTEGLGRRSRQDSMADTQALVLSLAKSLPDPAIGYTLYLDNLFPSIPLATALGQLGIGIMATARVNTLGLPLSLVQLKKGKESLQWGYLKTAIAKQIQCFLWQDNNKVLGMIIAYNYSL